MWVFSIFECFILEMTGTAAAVYDIILVTVAVIVEVA